MSSGYLKAPPGIRPFKVVQTLNNGDNPIVHNLGKEVTGYDVKNVDDFVEVNGNIIDANTFNINLAAGGPINNAIIVLSYID